MLWIVADSFIQLHENQLCPELKSTCPDCQTTVRRCDLSFHVDSLCPEALRTCPASKYGCPVECKQVDLEAHQHACPLFAMAPYLERQNFRLDSMEATVRHLQQRNELFEDGLATFRQKLFPADQRSRNNNNNNNSSRPSSSSNNNNNNQAATTGGNDLPAAAENNATTSYLLSVHESLREEVAHLSNAVRDLDARASMTIMNECLRINEEMSHTNAALVGMRMQIQWLMNPHLHYQARRTAADVDTTDSAQIGSAAAGPSTSSTSPRRLSDNGREGTKL